MQQAQLSPSLVPSTLAAIIEQAWEKRQEISPQTVGEIKESVQAVMQALDDGNLRVVDPEANWAVREWVKKAVLLSFRLSANKTMPGFTPDILAAGASYYFYDKAPLKFAGWHDTDFAAAGFRAVPGAIVRYGAYIAPNVVLMPCFINIGAWIGANTMIDIGAVVSSCAQVGKDCHISAGVLIGGVLEPLQATPVIIEDHCFIGMNSNIAEGVVVEQGSVISMGVNIGASTRIVDRETGEIFYGRVPAGSVVVPGTYQPEKAVAGIAQSCAVIVKKVDAGTRQKTSINELLRD
ncbi:MAG: 2,3,4,5-tetrahydropyridine-2,6-dicarboxylate N-succinyltransferase [Alphaproteobacteria bacterium]